MRLKPLYSVAARLVVLAAIAGALLVAIHNRGGNVWIVGPPLAVAYLLVGALHIASALTAQRVVQTEDEIEVIGRSRTFRISRSEIEVESLGWLKWLIGPGVRLKGRQPGPGVIVLSHTDGLSELLESLPNASASKGA